MLWYVELSKVKPSFSTSKTILAQHFTITFKGPNTPSLYIYCQGLGHLWVMQLVIQQDIALQLSPLQWRPSLFAVEASQTELDGARKGNKEWQWQGEECCRLVLNHCEFIWGRWRKSNQSRRITRGSCSIHNSGICSSCMKHGTLYSVAPCSHGRTTNTICARFSSRSCQNTM